jgi:hypothetical protein
MTAHLSLEFMVFILMLLVIAAAFDLWLIRTWKRHRKLSRRSGESSDSPDGLSGRQTAAKVPITAASKPGPDRRLRVNVSGDSGASGKSPHGRFHR